MSIQRLNGKKILILIAERFDELELLYPLYRFIEEGAKVTLAGNKAKEKYFGKYAYPMEAEVSYQNIDEKEYDALYIPGGYAPDKLRSHSAVLELVRHFHRSQKPIGAICHAGWVLISAQILNGVRCTSTSSIKDDMINAGANWVDAPVVIDRFIISSRGPDDLPFFCPSFIDLLIK